MKSLIVVIGLCLSLNSIAAEAGWKSTLRNILGTEWGNKLLGPASVEVVDPGVSLPEIPQQIKKSTDVGTYSKKVKDPTEYDRLPEEKRRQFDYRFLQELFEVTRKTQAKDEDLSNWLNTLDQGGSREGIYQALVLDEVYAALEGIDENPTQKLLDFSLLFNQKFFNQTFKKDSLSKLNLYSLKRIFTEKGLDLIEYYETKDLDLLYRWYAVFSAEIANNYPEFFKDDVRKNKSALFHYQWAKNMPIQHIKSEFIIKLHTLMNGLNNPS